MQAVHICLIVEFATTIPEDQWEVPKLQYVFQGVLLLFILSDIASHRIVAFCNPGELAYFEGHLKSFK